MSELRADTITGSDGSSPVTLTKQSAAKLWSNFNGTANTTRDSFNIASLTDRGSGLWTLSTSNSFSNDDYVGAGSASDSYPNAAGRNRMVLVMPNSASQVYVNGFDTSGDADDTLVYISAICHGDLA